MSKVLLLIAMLYMHIVDDYRHQGILASMKQKQWWKENAPDELYKRDYIVALIEHAFSWAVAIHIPAIVYMYLTGCTIHLFLFVALFVFEWALHAVVDDAKANDHTISLVADQIIHVFQIIGAWFVYITL